MMYGKVLDVSNSSHGYNQYDSIFYEQKIMIVYFNINNKNVKVYF